MEPLRIFIGFDHAESAAFYTLCSSIQRYASVPVSITPLALNNLRGVYKRKRHKLQSNEFSFTRFLVPYLCDYEGPALFMDCDMLVVTDIKKLFDQFDPDYAVQVVQHDHRPETQLKYLGTVQTSYEKKNWSSVMLFNCEACKSLTPQYIDKAAGLDLHQFKWLEGDWRVGNLGLEWNFLVDYYPNLPVDTLGILHYTEGGPYFDEYQGCSYAREWWAEYNYMRHTAQGSRGLKHYSEIAEKVG